MTPAVSQLPPAVSMWVLVDMRATTVHEFLALLPPPHIQTRPDSQLSLQYLPPEGIRVVYLFACNGI